MLPPVLLVLLHARRTLTLYILNRNQHPSPDVDAPLPPAQFLGVQDELGVGNRPVIDGQDLTDSMNEGLSCSIPSRWCGSWKVSLHPDEIVIYVDARHGV
jgi:hypothetical protein